MGFLDLVSTEVMYRLIGKTYSPAAFASSFILCDASIGFCAPLLGASEADILGIFGNRRRERKVKLANDDDEESRLDRNVKDGRRWWIVD